MPMTLPLILLEMVTSSSAQRVPTTSMERWTSCTLADLRMTGTGGAVVAFLASVWRSQALRVRSRLSRARIEIGRIRLRMANTDRSVLDFQYMHRPLVRQTAALAIKAK